VAVFVSRRAVCVLDRRAVASASCHAACISHVPLLPIWCQYVAAVCYVGSTAASSAILSACSLPGVLCCYGARTVETTVSLLCFYVLVFEFLSRSFSLLADLRLLTLHLRGSEYEKFSVVRSENIRHFFLNDGEFIEESGKEASRVGPCYGAAISCSCFSAIFANRDGVWSVCPYLFLNLSMSGFVCAFSRILQ
jgi:hypothetical protein